MTKFITVLSMSALLVFSGVSVFAGQSEDSSGKKSQKNQGAIESKSQTNPMHPEDTTHEQEKRARPGGVGEEGSIFGSPSTFPPGDTSQGYSGEDKKAEEQQQELEEQRK